MNKTLKTISVIIGMLFILFQAAVTAKTKIPYEGSVWDIFFAYIKMCIFSTIGVTIIIKSFFAKNK